jgi:hypothetical protein
MGKAPCLLAQQASSPCVEKTSLRCIKASLLLKKPTNGVKPLLDTKILDTKTKALAVVFLLFAKASSKKKASRIWA